jgi:hypothetical protein
MRHQVISPTSQARLMEAMPPTKGCLQGEARSKLMRSNEHKDPS